MAHLDLHKNGIMVDAKVGGFSDGYETIIKIYSEKTPKELNLWAIGLFAFPVLICDSKDILAPWKLFYNEV